MKALFGIVGIGLLALNTGCATIVDGSTDEVSVNTTGCGNEDKSEVQCTLKSGDRTYYTKAPGTVTVEKSAKALHVLCESGDGTEGSTVVQSSYSAMNIGNVLIGGGVGIIVDAVSGAMWHYPSEVVVPMDCPSQAPETNDEGES